MARKTLHRNLSAVQEKTLQNGDGVTGGYMLIWLHANIGSSGVLNRSGLRRMT
jgi:hypothetical protein